ncbi:type II toxin-antitoxin system VapC family toxin [Devosia aurantiaca]|uniref:Ribonuclease VapC n=1 Tax=Devosia aurantiaca TaxID=2714858 RepID=A0A6M1SM55_9HYPH|nr:type II toxin-antitoxin system VapC family toxin [Devosia aurantiaca]NGP16375.1 type II toxin-antitoxin system VapC family toxin [Devosia aurantiaca]
MFVDASAAISILSGEEDAAALAARLDTAPVVLMSPMSIYETVAGLARKRQCPIEEALAMVDFFIAETSATIVDIDDKTGRIAILAFAKFGKGRHPADLNMGDCFAYACAQVHSVALLYNGDDFVHTDISKA